MSNPFVLDIMRRGKECPFRGTYTNNPICLEDKCAIWMGDRCGMSPASTNKRAYEIRNYVLMMIALTWTAVAMGIVFIAQRVTGG